MLIGAEPVGLLTRVGSAVRAENGKDATKRLESAVLKVSSKDRDHSDYFERRRQFGAANGTPDHSVALAIAGNPRQQSMLSSGGRSLEFHVECEEAVKQLELPVEVALA
jgi:hypothetical protein